MSNTNYSFILKNTLSSIIQFFNWFIPLPYDYKLYAYVVKILINF